MRYGSRIGPRTIMLCMPSLEIEASAFVYYSPHSRCGLRDESSESNILSCTDTLKRTISRAYLLLFGHLIDNWILFYFWLNFYYVRTPPVYVIKDLTEHH
jgi:hypothetical protein